MIIRIHSIVGSPILVGSEHSLTSCIVSVTCYLVSVICSFMTPSYQLFESSILIHSDVVLSALGTPGWSRTIRQLSIAHPDPGDEH